MRNPLTVKFGVIVLVAVALLIVIQIISSTVWDRQVFRQQALNNISTSWTGAQEVAGPVLRIPYTLEWQAERWAADGSKQTQTKRQKGELYLVPQTLIQHVEVTSDTRRKGIFEIPVYEANISMEGLFDLTHHFDQEHPNATITYGTPTIGLGIKDARGIAEASSIRWASRDLGFEAGSRLPYLPQGLNATISIDPDSDQTVSFETRFTLRGLESLMFQPSAKNFELSMAADWPHPSFTGSFLPVRREISNQGFTANWSTNEFSSAVHRETTNCSVDSCNLTTESALGVDFIQPVDIYAKTQRSLKYAILFIIVIFAAFFVFEVLRALPIHPVQYGLVGLAISSFYLLLLSLTEHINFGLAYTLGTVACVSLIAVYLRSILKSGAATAAFTGSLTCLYLVLYVIVSAEDFALLMGTGLLFAMLATLMLSTRHIDWYSLSKPFSQPEDS